MGHESQIELWSPNLTTFCFAGFGTAGLRRQETMKTAGRENPIHGVRVPRNRAHGAVGQNRSRSIKWAAKQEKFQPEEMCFFLTSPFMELTRSWQLIALAVHNPYAKNSTIPVSRLYIEPAIFMLPLDSRSRSTGLFSRMLAIVADTFFRATASTNV